jgi:hypothetical protein
MSAHLLAQLLCWFILRTPTTQVQQESIKQTVLKGHEDPLLATPLMEMRGLTCRHSMFNQAAAFGKVAADAHVGASLSSIAAKKVRNAVCGLSMAPQ